MLARAILALSACDSEPRPCVPFDPTRAVLPDGRAGCREANGRLEYLRAADCSPPDLRVDSQAPFFTEGRPASPVVRRGSIFSTCGLENGDVIRRIDGVSTQSMDAMYDTFVKVDAPGLHLIDLERRGEPMTLEIHTLD